MPRKSIIKKIEDIARGKQPDYQRILELLPDIPIEDEISVIRSLKRLKQLCPDSETFANLVVELFPHLLNTPSPESVLVIFEHFLEKHSTPRNYQLFLSEPRILEVLVALFSGSQFLSQILLRHPEYLSSITDRNYLLQPRSKEELLKEITEWLSDGRGIDDQKLLLRQFQQREILRIGTADLLGLLDLYTVTNQLSVLADVIIDATLKLCTAALGMETTGFAILAAGKLGGEELNYSSDIDLLFISESGDDQFQRLGKKLIDVLSESTPEGFLYRVDMRLRPWGRTGRLVPGIDEHLTYFRKHARLWEKQAMLKLRWIAGDETTGIQFIRNLRPLIFEVPIAELRDEVQKMKAEIEAKLRIKRREWGEVKQGKGSIRDVEFVCQYLQLVHGKEHPEIRSRNTLDALARLAAFHILQPHEYRILSEGYIFLRAVEHHLQIMHNRQTHLLPDALQELHQLAKRLGFEGKDSEKQLLQRYQQHRDAIRAVFLHHLGKEHMEVEHLASLDQQKKTVSEVKQKHIARLDDSYTRFFSENEIALHTRLVQQLNEQTPVVLEVEEEKPQREWKITIVGYDYLGELSLICGLLFVYGLNIEEGQVFTYEPVSIPDTTSPPRKPLRAERRFPHRKKSGSDTRRKIVDVFRVSSIRGDLKANIWEEYREELLSLISLLRQKQQREAHGYLARRVADVLPEIATSSQVLFPVTIDIDNSAHQQYTLLHIDAPDTPGFLYELTNALALNGIYISRVLVSSLGNRVHDTLFITDMNWQKITRPETLLQLRIATLLVKQFTHLLPQSPNPESAMLHFREFVSELFTHENWATELSTLEQPQVLGALARLLGGSDFLWEDFLRMQHENLFPILSDLQLLQKRKKKSEMRQELVATLPHSSSFDEFRNRLNAFKDREMFRIDMRYILNEYRNFTQFSAELTDLAEVVIEAAFQNAYMVLKEQFGEPYLENQKLCRLCIGALGKFGGEELGFASDIELMFIYEGDGYTSGDSPITNGEFFDRLVKLIKESIVTRREGIFEIDLRLRPYGKAGTLAVPLERFVNYFSPKGPAWQYERQALVKFRPIIGDRGFIRKVLNARNRCIYQETTFDLAEFRALREKQIRQLVTGGTINGKYSPGGLVDIEYLVQALQMKHGMKDAKLRTTNTGKAMKALLEKNIISKEEFERLSHAHHFLRSLIEALRMVRGNARDLTVPSLESSEFAFLARRLGYSSDYNQLWEDILHHTGVVQKLTEKLLA
ncbi:MAG: glutamine synthetase adenylyltransferase [Calditrichaeota bacterium]|nr:MAG: glutamine synthetase adenylyltransferase [Calditrichota bacterium]